MQWLKRHPNVDSLLRAVSVLLIIFLILVAKYIKEFMFNVTPSVDALVDIATIEGVLITIALPLSFEIISRISDRYGSEAVIKAFLSEWVNRVLLIYLIINVIVVVFISEIASSLEHSSLMAWKIIAWSIFITFALGLLFFIIFTRRLNDYITKPTYVTDKLADKADEILS